MGDKRDARTSQDDASNNAGDPEDTGAGSPETTAAKPRKALPILRPRSSDSESSASQELGGRRSRTFTEKGSKYGNFSAASSAKPPPAAAPKPPPLTGAALAR